MWSCSKLEVTWGAAALLLMALIAGAGEVLPLVALSALCHELGHLTALKLVGAKVEQIRLTAFGAEIRADTRYLSYGREIFCTLAGPAVNLFLAVVLARVTGDYLMAGANLFLGVFNLLPLPVLDGGHIFFAAIELIFRHPVPKWLVKNLSLIFIVLLFSAMALLTMLDVMRLVPPEEVELKEPVIVSIDNPEPPADAAEGSETEAQK